MSRWPLRVAALVLLTGVLGVARPAAADPEGRLADLSFERGALRLVFSASDLLPGQAIDPASVEVTLDGIPVDATARPISGGTEELLGAPTRTAVLVIDSSRSMQGEKLTAAKAAAVQFLQSVPDDVRVGLVDVSGQATVVAAPTTDRGAVLTGLDSVTAGGKSAIYDGVLTALEVAGARGTHNLVLLSDGGENGSMADLGSTLQGLEASEADLDAVSIGNRAEQVRQLTELTDAVSGRVLSLDDQLDPAELVAAFADVAREISRQLQVRVDVPPDMLGQSVSVVVDAVAGSTAVSGEAEYRLVEDAPGGLAASGPRPYSLSRGPLASPAVLPVALAALFLGAALLLALAVTTVVPAARSDARVRRRLSIYTLTGGAPVKERETTALGASHLARSAVELAGRVVARRDLEGVLAQKLEAAAVPLKPPEWLLIHVGFTLAGSLLLLLLSGGSIPAAVVGIVLGVSVPWLWLGFKDSRRTGAFLAQLPDTLQVIAGSLSAGYSLPQAIDSVVRESSPPVSTEFNRALVEARLGVPIEDALDAIADRMASEDFGWVVMAIRIQREVGGNLAEVLSTVAATLRERERLRRQVRVLSAEGRLSAWVLGLLPPVFTVYLALVRPSYLRPLVTEAIGWVLIAVAVLLMTTGVVWLRKVVRVEV